MSLSQSHQDLQSILEQLRNLSDVTQLADGFNSQPQLMVDAIKILTQQFDQSSEREHELLLSQQRVRELESSLNSARSQRRHTNNEELLSRLADLIIARPQPTPKSPMIPDSPVFSGDKKDFLSWKSSLLLKLNINADHYPDEQSRMAYIYSRLNSQSQSHLQSWLNNGILTFSSVDHMIGLLGTLFDDPNRARDAAARLHSNYQRNRPFVGWIAEIRRDAAIAGYDSSSLALRNIILFNMSIELKRAIIHERDIEALNIDEIISRLQDIDNRQRSLTNLLNRGNHNPNSRSSASPQQKLVPLVTQDDAMDLSSTQTQRRGPLSQEEKDRRRKLGLCNYCGEKGHLVRNCPIRPHHISRAIDLDEENDNEEGSGKEIAL